MDHRAVKDRLYAAWAETAKALASPKRVELLDLLAQGERTVEALAREAGLTINNTSSHLGVLKAARLVETRKAAQFVFHRLADDAVVDLLRAVQAVARRRLHEVDHLARTYLDGRDPLEPVRPEPNPAEPRPAEATLRPESISNAALVRSPPSWPVS